MAWTYGDTLCVLPNIPICDWVYGETLCIVLPSVVYPTSAKVRVTSLVHRWNPGNYTLEIGLGALTTEFDIADIIARPLAPGVVGPIPPEPPGPPGPSPIIAGPCLIGSRRCFGHHYYECRHTPITEGPPYSAWILIQADAPACLGHPLDGMLRRH